MTSTSDLDVAALPGATSRRPAVVRDVELCRELAGIAAGLDGRAYEQAFLLVRVDDEPVGIVRMTLPERALTTDELAAAVSEQCGGAVALAQERNGSHRKNQQRWREQGPDITVVICTRNRTDDLARALASLRRQTYDRFSVLVVDNAPSDDRTERLVADHSGVRYLREQRPGLSWARNAALATVVTPVVAWLDDDEVADPDWLVEIAAAFCLEPAAAAVSGAVLPAELETWPQLWFEEYGGHSKGRGFVGDVFRAGDAHGQSPLFPLPPFGVGANMAFSTERLRAIGGFDTALGAGTQACGGEDTLVFTRLLLAGDAIVYRPTSLTRHYHRADDEGLAQQMRGYGVGLTAYYASLVLSDWRLVAPLVRLLPRAVRHLTRDSSSSLPESFPRELLRLKSRGMLQGPISYVRARRHARTLAGR